MSFVASNKYQPQSHPPHPYYPVEGEIVGYLANTYTVLHLLTIFATGSSLLFLVTGLAAKKTNPSLSNHDVMTVMWFVLSGSVHVFFEGYYVYNYASMGSKQTIFGQMWKEYALSDSRYLTQDAFVFCIECITVLTWGPLSFLVAYLTTLSHPLRHPLQIVVSVAHIYGDVLYYATGAFALYMHDIQYCRPEAYYFWVYYFGFNFLWIVIPAVLIYSSANQVGRAFHSLEKAEKIFGATALSTEEAYGMKGVDVKPKLNGEIKKME